MPFRRGPLARRRARGRSRRRRRRGTTRRARCARSASASSGSIAPRSVVPGGADDRDHVLALGRRVERVERHRAGRVGLDADHGLGAEPEQRGGAADAVVRGRARRRSASRFGGQAVACGRPRRRGRAPAAARAGSRPSRPSSSRRSRCAPEPVLAREPADERVLDERRRGRGVEGVHRLVRHADRPARPRRRRSAARGAGARPCAGRRAGCRRRAPARASSSTCSSGAPSSGHGSIAATAAASSRGRERRARAGQRRRERDERVDAPPSSRRAAPRARRGRARHEQGVRSSPHAVRSVQRFGRARGGRRAAPLARGAALAPPQRRPRRRRAARTARAGHSAAPVKSGKTTTGGPHGALRVDLEPAAEAAAALGEHEPGARAEREQGEQRRRAAAGCGAGPRPSARRRAGSAATSGTPGNAAAQAGGGEQRDDEQLRADDAEQQPGARLGLAAGERDARELVAPRAVQQPAGEEHEREQRRPAQQPGVAIQPQPGEPRQPLDVAERQLRQARRAPPRAASGRRRSGR